MLKDKFDNQSDIGLKIEPMIVFQKVLSNRNSIQKIRCIKTHEGVGRVKNDKGTVMFVPYSFIAGTRFHRNSVIVKHPDNWVLD